MEKLSSAKRTVLYRVTQEALSNVARHAHASKVGVTIQGLRSSILVQIKDDGRSFDVERLWLSGKRQRLGLLGMRERVEMVGGRFTVESSPGSGTLIQAQIPFRAGIRGQA